MIYTVTLNPALDKTVEIPSLTVGAVNRITQMRTDPGGKGINVSKVIQKLGGKSIAIGVLGGHTGRSIQTALEEAGLQTDFTFTEGETRTNLKVIDPINHTNTDINEPGVIVSSEQLDGMLQKLLRSIFSELCSSGDASLARTAVSAAADSETLSADKSTGASWPNRAAMEAQSQTTAAAPIVVISGSMPKGSPKDTYYTWTKAAAQAGAKVFLDADGELLKAGLNASPYLIKPNNHELSELMGQTLTTPEELERAARTLMAQYQITKVVVSMGGAGALYVTADQTIYAEGLNVPVGSTVGAGDSVVAALAFAEERGLSLEDVVRLSTATGAANVMCSGSQAAEYDVIQMLLPKVLFRRL